MENDQLRAYASHYRDLRHPTYIRFEEGSFGDEGRLSQKVWRVRGFVTEENEVERAFLAPLIFRKEESLSSRSIQLTNYQILHERGYPVPRTFRATKNGLLMSDLTEDRRNLVLTIPRSDRTYAQELRLQADTLDRLQQVDLDRACADAITRFHEAERRSSVYFRNTGAFFLVIRPDLSTDLQIARFEQIYSSQEFDPATINASSLRFFFQWMKWVKQEVANGRFTQ